ncbi:MAG: hydroxymethylbilane synthase [Candidatus Marinimicrobia bacterium]|nr:hydroxymethylbilane synthase [Candidatus Neomarinimicrobiota bacterium]|tara:strand:+ start:3306 stop:4232 length:927 start_codon:yes stop_codon:yes gene_type:complete
MKKLIIGTRGSNLALNQAKSVKEKILKIFPDIKIDTKTIKTEGDIDLKTPIRNILDKGFYTKEIEKALLDSSINIAVHSMKDLPLELDSKFQIGAVLKRRSPMDVILSNNYKTINEFPGTPTIAVGSLRRRLQLKKIFPNVKLVDIRGNIETRIKKLIDNKWDGLIMAKAAIERLSIKHMFYEFNIDEMIPAPCQGIVAIENLKSDSELVPILDAINNNKTFKISRVERDIAKKLEGGCKVPVGCLATIEDNILHINAYIANNDGSMVIKEKISADLKEIDIDSIVNKLISNMSKNGLNDILNQRFKN